MPTRSDRETTHESKQLHPGSSKEDALAMGGEGDFGVPENDVVNRTYTSENTKRSDPGGAPARGGEDGSRTSGVGGNISGVGSSSGGDLDPDIVGVGIGGAGVAASGKIHEPTGPDDAENPNDAGDSDAHTKGVYRPARKSKGSVVQTGDARTAGSDGSDSASGTHPDDDSFAGEISADEASGRNDMP